MNVALGPERLERAAASPPSTRAGKAGPWEQAFRLAFAFLALVVLVLALGWATSNVRQVPPDSRAVVLRLGAFARQQDSGLLLAWPRPIEEVVLLPAEGRQIELPIARFDPAILGLRAPLAPRINAEARRNAGFLLTGDLGIVSLRATLFYGIVDPGAYVLARAHVTPALERLLVASAVHVSASRDLDAILVARSGDAAAGDAQGARERLRADLLREVNARLASLADAGAGLGVRVRRIDLVAALPADAKEAFDEVLRTAQVVGGEIAQARTLAANTMAGAVQQRDAMVAEARAAAAERRSQAVAHTAPVAALIAQAGTEAGRAVLERTYAERVSQLLHRAARVELVDPRAGGGARILLPGSQR